MLILPAIDILDGCCVRLFQGKFDAATRYSRDPLETAREFERAGFTSLHLVDLNGARDGEMLNRDLILRIAEGTSLRLQVGGGLRRPEDVTPLLRRGIWRIVVGTVAVRNPPLLRDWLKEHGAGRIVVAVDLYEGKIASEGWKKLSFREECHSGEGSPGSRGERDAPGPAFPGVETFISSLEETGVRTILCTDISRDGTLSSPNVSLYVRLTGSFPHLQILASGGVGGVEDILRLKETGVAGVVIGKALYEGKVSIQELVALQGPEERSAQRKAARGEEDPGTADK